MPFCGKTKTCMFWKTSEEVFKRIKLFKTYPKYDFDWYDWEVCRYSFKNKFEVLNNTFEKANKSVLTLEISRGCVMIENSLRRGVLINLSVYWHHSFEFLFMFGLHICTIHLLAKPAQNSKSLRKYMLSFIRNSIVTQPRF